MNNNHDTDLHSNDLTQLSSREQLSALMDGALPADQTRFLLRRLQHDDSLAASWERWRMAGEAMRGIAPAHRLPADFAARVSVALHGDDAQLPSQQIAQGASRTPAWLRWGGGAAMAASLAVVALLAVRPDAAPADPDGLQIAVAPAAPSSPAGETPAPMPPVVAEAPVALVAAAAAAAQPVRERRIPARNARQAPAATEGMLAKADAPAVAATPAVPLPQDGIVTRPWPRSVLPQYAHGGLTVGFGETAASTPAHNPFQQPRLVMAPVQAPAADAEPAPPSGDAGDATPANEPAPAQP